MAFWSQLGSNFAKFVNEYGVPYAVQNLSQTFAAGSYDEPAYSSSGTKLVGSCMFMPVSTRFAGEERQFIEAGLLQIQDMKAYIPSGLDIDEFADIVIAGGSYKIAPTRTGAIQTYPNATAEVYKKIYLRNKMP